MGGLPVLPTFVLWVNWSASREFQSLGDSPILTMEPEAKSFCRVTFGVLGVQAPMGCSNSSSFNPQLEEIVFS
ncbi:hypothetical protein BDZ94DRAFT_1272126 [Collybia nuda]|uniref:Uncharacterized protein n=1 Tax=Collybia nuda TaxID=64659 RepID=A0A9P5XUL0_9AGAR|nr:hypothetical protein BDZ94DRAFT_1272126 [Collybia nuda]